MIIIFKYKKGGDFLENVIRRSKNRDAILEILRSTKSHPSAEWVYQRLKEQLPEAGLATVYRNLKLLEEQGLVKRLSFTDGCDRYDADMGAHAHCRCTSCGRVLDMPAPEFATQLPDGFCECGREVIFYGTCRDCQREHRS